MRVTSLHVVKQGDPKPKKDDRVGLLNPSFKYTKAAETDIRKTFARIRREQAKKGGGRAR